MEYQEAIDIIKGKSGLYEITTPQGSNKNVVTSAKFSPGHHAQI